ncbi:hypothetical protein [Priestia abyssalis]|uniref:hypothetical protein n=1 Tax=Priestia abyssalis TaxID=1221450 RepID=UPI000995D5E3|nr:hypothetical protein [Priestia abyssalis]
MKLLKIFLVSMMLNLSFIVAASANYTSAEFQKSLVDVGYKSVFEALEESNNHFQRDIALPVQLPPISFTHSLGRLTNLDGEINDSFEITYMNKDYIKNHYEIRVVPSMYRIEFRDGQIDQTFKLKDGNKAIYSTNKTRGFNLLAFEKDNWQYILSINKSVSDKVPARILVEIADSIK